MTCLAGGVSYGFLGVSFYLHNCFARGRCLINCADYFTDGSTIEVLYRGDVGGNVKCVVTCFVEVSFYGQF